MEHSVQRLASHMRLMEPDCYSVLYPQHPRAAASWRRSSESVVRGSRDVVKEILDRLMAAVLLALLLPVLCGISALIKLESDGPVLFRQLRIGYEGRLFAILKFRTMYHARSDLVSARQTEPGDPRITKVGAVLRKLSLDELPQLFNVLAGNMSLVGPRPLAPGTSIGGVPVDNLVPDFARRYSVKPGITGLAQARGLRGALSTMSQLSERVAADIEYVRDHSLWLDLKIMVATAAHEVRKPRGS